jgi:NAD(P)-dependent dehydrogenase (short-subunit alcohol dehydrogenase family)
MEKQGYILITGASSSIGSHIAVKLSRHFNLILNGRNVESLNNIRSQCHLQDRHIIWASDIGKIEELESSLRELIMQAEIVVDGFVHCAGYIKLLPLKSISLANLQETMNVNFNSAVLLIKLLINKKINKSSLNKVVFISSTASIMGAKGFNVYSASKGALDSLMRSLAIELAPNVRLNSVLPGAIRTKMTESLFNDPILRERMEKEYPLGLGEANDIFEMVDFLLSEKARWITGQQFVVDGGRSVNISA